MRRKSLHDQLLGNKRDAERKNPRVFKEREYTKLWRGAFQRVIETCNDILSVLGNIEAMDYTSLKENDGPMYAPPRGFPLLEFTVDVKNLAEKALTPDEFGFFSRQVYGNQDLDYTYQNEAFLSMQDKLGRVFVGQGLFPPHQYFVTIKK